MEHSVSRIPALLLICSVLLAPAWLGATPAAWAAAAPPGLLLALYVLAGRMRR